jgi:hypothetical protein
MIEMNEQDRVLFGAFNAEGAKEIQPGVQRKRDSGDRSIRLSNPCQGVTETELCKVTSADKIFAQNRKASLK